MKEKDLLAEFERLSVYLMDDKPPTVRVAARVMSVVRAAESGANRTLEAVAVMSFVLAIVVALLGFSQLSEASGPLDAFFQIVPPIGL